MNQNTLLIRDLLEKKGLTPSKFDLRSTTLFDVYPHAAAVGTENPLFIGQTVRGKVNSNIVQPNIAVPSPDWFAVTGISVVIGGAVAAADVLKLMDGSALRIDITDRAIFEGPSGAFTYQAAAAMGVRPIYSLDYPILLPGNTRISGYHLTTHGAALSAISNVGVVLHGVRATPR